MTPPRRQRRILRNVEFAEFSAVDFPAHEGARIVMQKRAPILMTKNEPSPKEPETMSTPDLATVQAALTKAQADLTAMTADRDAVNKQLAYFERVAQLSDAERAHLATLSDAERPAWVGKSAAARAADVKAAQDADEVVVTFDDGSVVRKSAGDIVIGMAKRSRLLEQQLAKQAAAAERTRLEKRAETELGKVGGTLDGKVALVKAIESIADEKERAAAEAVLKAAAAVAKVAFSPQGASNSSDRVGANPDDIIQAKAEAYAKANKVPVAKAWSILLDPTHDDHDDEAIEAYASFEDERRGNR